MKTLHPTASIPRQKGGAARRLTLPLALSLILTMAWALGAPAPGHAEMNLSQTLSDGAQRCTIAFDGFAFATGNLEAQSFFPPGKVADYWGFQYLRDNTPNGNGHNTSFLTNCAFNVLYTLNDTQFAALKTLAASQVDQINLYAYKRFPLMKAFRRQMDKDIPSGSTGLSLSAVKTASADLYALDGQISFDRAVVYATILQTLSDSQEQYLADMKTGGFDSWTVTTEMETFVKNRMKDVSHDVSVALMTYAGDLFSWYAGSLDADVYFCPERQGTYFGSFYVKDAPAIGHEGYKIDEQLTASAGQKFLDALASNGLDSLVTSLVNTQKDDLYAGTANIVQARTDISTLLRSLKDASVLTADLKAQVLSQVLEKSRTYGELDGEIVYSYAIAFAKVYQSMTAAQKTSMATLRKAIMSGTYNNTPFDYSVCTTPFLYSAVIQDLTTLTPYISHTDYLFGVADDETVAITLSPSKATVQAGKTQQFTARVTGTTDTRVTWQVNGLTGGSAAVGTISTSGLYTAPSTVPSPATMTVTAIAAADTTKSAKATVTVIKRVYTTVTLLAPNGGQVLTSGGTFSIQWGAPATAKSFKLAYSLDGGATWKAVSTSYLTGTSFTWKVPVVATTRTACKVGVTSYDANRVRLGADQSDKTFSIRPAATGTFSLRSSVGANGGTLPAEYTCDGAGSSPPLSWSNVPAGTKELALMMTTLPGDGTTKWNWVLYRIPAATTSLAKNSSGVGTPGVGSHGTTPGYEPPCSQGPGAKLYTFTLYALSSAPTLPATAEQVTGPVLTQAISSITLGSASLSLSYTRP